jgi:segregation and condensation protein B
MILEDFGETKKQVEAILFASARVVSEDELSRLASCKTPGLVKEVIKEIKEEYSARDSPIMIVDEADGWKLTVKEKYLPVVQRINTETELSKATMETLAIVAWRTPVLQSDVIHIRTNKAYDHITELEEKGFISREKFGRTYMIKATKKFYDYFDIPDQAALKELFKEFKDLAPQKRMEDFNAGKEGQISAEGGVSGVVVGVSGLEVFDVPAPGPSDLKAQSSGNEVVRDGKLGSLDVFDVAEKNVEEEVDDSKIDASLEESLVSAEGSVDESVQKKAEEDEGLSDLHEESDAERARRLAKELLDETGDVFDSLPVKKTKGGKQKQGKRSVLSGSDLSDGDSSEEGSKDTFEEFPGQRRDVD